mmetsp:Transcript_23502/g.54640  ORF Transcript_23502/g.54640 Transcript_23502/m.54640 type:complete len:331 (-) Transcript_23502:80-1072(-)
MDAALLNNGKVARGEVALHPLDLDILVKVEGVDNLPRKRYVATRLVLQLFQLKRAHVLGHALHPGVQRLPSVDCLAQHPAQSRVGGSKGKELLPHCLRPVIKPRDLLPRPHRRHARRQQGRLRPLVHEPVGQEGLREAEVGVVGGGDCVVKARNGLGAHRGVGQERGPHPRPRRRPRPVGCLVRFCLGLAPLLSSGSLHLLLLLPRLLADNVAHPPLYPPVVKAAGGIQQVSPKAHTRAEEAGRELVEGVGDAVVLLVRGRRLLVQVVVERLSPPRSVGGLVLVGLPRHPQPPLLQGSGPGGVQVQDGQGRHGTQGEASRSHEHHPAPPW